jgi:hypothetical protein
LNADKVSTVGLNSLQATDLGAIDNPLVRKPPRPPLEMGLDMNVIQVIEYGCGKPPRRIYRVKKAERPAKENDSR